MLKFMGIGAQKSATTWLYRMLSRHEDIAFPRGKEVHFWDHYHPRDLARYRSLFDQADKLEGDITPSYSTLPVTVIREVAKHFPDIRLIFIMRNPIDRAWSGALMALKQAGMEFHEASDQWFLDHFRSQGSRKRGDYESCVRNWRSAFPEDQLLLLFHEQVVTEPRDVLLKCAGHIGVTTDPFISLDHRFIRLKVNKGISEPMRPGFHRELTNLYKDKILSLADYLRFNLDHWLV